MKKIEKYVNTFGMPVLSVLAGLILLVNPDGATALVTKLIGWAAVIIGALMLIGPTLKHQKISPGTWLLNGCAILVGVLLLARPMILADGIGRVFGIFLLLEGFRNLRIDGTRLMPIVTIVAGIILFIIPRTLTNTLLAVVGVVLLITGIVQILGKVYAQKHLEEAQDPNIIDADV